MRGRIGASWVVLGVVGLSLWGGCVSQDNFVRLNNRVMALEQGADTERESLRSKIESYHEDQMRTEQDSRGKHAELHALFNDLRDEIMELKGAVEEDQYSANQWRAHSKHLEGSLQGLQDRVDRIEQYLGMQPSDKLAVSGADEDKPIREDEGEPETPEALYDRAEQRFNRGEYEDARESFRSFLKQYPKSEMADDAQFWLGEIYLREGWYEKAILAYQKVIEDHPKGNKTPSALLKQGFAFLSLDDNTNAGLILKELIRKFPDSDEANIAKNKLKTLK